MENRETLTLDSFQQPDVCAGNTANRGSSIWGTAEAQISAEQLEEAKDLGWKSQEEYKETLITGYQLDQFLDKVENDLGTQKGVIKRQLRGAEKAS